MGFFSGGWKDRQTYGFDKNQRQFVGNEAYEQTNSMYQQDPGTYWGQTYGGFTDRYGLQDLNPQGGLTWDHLTGRGPGGIGGGPGGSFGPSFASAGRATAGHANASLVDINAEPYQTKMNETVSQGVLGRGHQLLGAQKREANRGVETQAALTGMSPVASAYLKHLNEQKAADSLGNAYGQFETDWVRSALNRQDSARQLNAQLGTDVSKFNAQEQGITSRFNVGEGNAMSRFNAGVGNAWGEADAARQAQASELLLKLWDRNQDRDVGRYGQMNEQAYNWLRPTGNLTQDQSGFSKLMGGISQVAGIAAPFFSGPVGPGSYGSSGGHGQGRGYSYFDPSQPWMGGGY